MHILIDKTQLRMVAAAGTRKWINLVSYVDFPGIDAVVVDSMEGRTWSALTREQVSALYTNMSGQPAPEYSEAIQQLAAYAGTWPPYPKSEAALEVEAEAIWQAEQAGKTDADRVAEAAQQTAQQREAHQATIIAAEQLHNLAPGNEGSKPMQEASRSAEQAAAKPPTSAQARPQQGATKKIWDIADDLLAVTGTIGNVKAFRKEVIDRAKALGLNEGTAATQFGKWKATKGL